MLSLLKITVHNQAQIAKEEEEEEGEEKEAHTRKINRDKEKKKKKKEKRVCVFRENKGKRVLDGVGVK